MRILSTVALGAALLTSALGAQEVARCADAHRFLVDVVGMTAITEPDTIDDWRTQKMVPGCRVTAAGLTERTQRDTAADFFEQVRSDGWVRTPDPRDAPNEASLRFRRNENDCLFNFYTGGILMTEAEATVDDAVVPGPGEERYNFLVLCMPAMEAVPRS